MKKLYFGTNLKMYKTVKETEIYLRELEKCTKDISREEIELFVIPSYTALQMASKSRDVKYIKLGAQNMCWEEEGQFTGEISPVMLKELDLELVMIGHSERRHVFGETNRCENLKVKTALKHGFTTLLCVGETAEEKSYGIAVETLRTQLKIGCSGLEKHLLSKLWIAYEPVWSIGVGGTPATAKYAESIHWEIKKCLLELFGQEGYQIPVLYGGSVNKENAAQMIAQPSVDGLFVGRSAWEAEKFNVLIRDAKRAYNEINDR